MLLFLLFICSGAGGIKNQQDSPAYTHRNKKMKKNPALIVKG